MHFLADCFHKFVCMVSCFIVAMFSIHFVFFFLKFFYSFFDHNGHCQSSSCCCKYLLVSEQTKNIVCKFYTKLFLSIVKEKSGVCFKAIIRAASARMGVSMQQKHSQNLHQDYVTVVILEVTNTSRCSCQGFAFLRTHKHPYLSETSGMRLCLWNIELR